MSYTIAPDRYTLKCHAATIRTGLVDALHSSFTRHKRREEEFFLCKWGCLLGRCTHFRHPPLGDKRDKLGGRRFEWCKNLLGNCKNGSGAHLSLAPQKEMVRLMNFGLMYWRAARVYGTGGWQVRRSWVGGLALPHNIVDCKKCIVDGKKTPYRGRTQETASQQKHQSAGCTPQLRS